MLIREDGRFLYTLPSVVDDIDFAITHVIRGSDHITNTGVQIQLIRALGAEPPAYAHYSLLNGPEGKPLSKREDAARFSLAALREAGYEPMALNSLLARLGTPDPIEACLSLASWPHFDISAPRPPDIRFDPVTSPASTPPPAPDALRRCKPRLAALSAISGRPSGTP